MNLRRIWAESAFLLLTLAGVASGQVITNLSPALGAVGDPVTIYGNNFGTTFTSITNVWFHGTPVPVGNISVVADFQINIAQVPAGATTGDVTLKKPGGAVVSSTNSPTHPGLIFTVAGAGPYVTNFFNGTLGNVTGNVGSTVTILGIHLTAANLVSFNGVPSTGTNLQTDWQIQATVPPGAMSGPIVVRTAAGSFSTTNNTLSAATNFFLPPVITGFATNIGRAGSNNVIITGSNFLASDSVKFAGTAATFIVLSNRAINATVPAGAVTGPIFVSAPAGSVTTTSNFLVQPTISSIAPTTGNFGTSVVISGSNLNEKNPKPTVAFAMSGGTTNALIVGTPAFGSITCLVPTGAISGPITVTTTNGSDTSGQNFYLPPAITAFNPTNSAPGSIVQISGNNFTGITAVLFNGLSASNFWVTNNSTIGAGVPSGVITGPISVTGPAGSVTNTSLLFYGAPLIFGFTPVHGLDGTNVLIRGTNLLNASAVFFANIAVLPPLHATNNGSLSVTVPPLPSNVTNGPIKVVAPAGFAVTSSNFVFDLFADLNVSAVADPSPVFVGSNLVYTIYVANNGRFDAPNTRMTNWLPASVTLNSASTTVGTLNTNSNPITASFGTIVDQGEAVVTLAVTPTAVGTITNLTVGVSDVPDPTGGTATNVTTVWPPAVLNIRNLPPGQVRVSWPAALSNFTLQFNTNLAQPAWSNLTVLPAISNNESIVDQSAAGTNGFFRLKH
jgi:uncharacterized repeat protein (TIGR01451 family)